MLLQTLVENAVFHGFVPLEMNGQINIILTKTSGTLEIVVSDNGMGMSQERLEEIRRAMNEDGQGVGIGLKHLVESVKLYYGPNSYINIFSREGAGTTFLIVLQLPVTAQEQMR
jgi:two-component system sensor histidine kinase YesM